MDIVHLLQFVGNNQILFTIKTYYIEIDYSFHTDFIISQDEDELLKKAKEEQINFFNDIVKLYPSHKVTKLNYIKE